MNQFLNFVFSAAILTFLLSDGLSQDPCQMTIGTNLHFYAAGVHKDLKMSSSKFYSRNDVYIHNNGQNNWDSNLIDSIETDDAGYPLVVPFSYDHDSIMTDQIVAFTVGGYEMQYDTGRYVMLYDGVGTFDFVAWTYTTVVTMDPGRIVFNVDSVTENGIHIEMPSSELGNHVRNIRIVKLEDEIAFISEPYLESFESKLTQFPLVRFMDWAETNNNEIAQWNDRIKPNYHSQENFQKGMAWEHMIDLANYFDVDIWVNVPHLADTTYIDSMAILFRDQLEVDRKIYLEYSNECWNYIFEQTYWLDSIGPYPDNMARNYGYYAHRVMSRWDDIFTGQESRITSVLAGTDYFVIDAMDFFISQGDGDLVDDMSYPGYVSLSESNYITLSEAGVDASADMVLDMLVDNMDSSLYWMGQFKELCTDTYDKRFVMYEGGQHITPQWFGLDTSYNHALYDAQVHPRMYEFYKDLLSYFRDTLEVEMLAHFTLASTQENPFGSWGLLDSYKDIGPWPVKYQAILDIINSCEFTDPEVDLFLGSNFIEFFHSSTDDQFEIHGLEGHYDITLLDGSGMLIEDLSEHKLPIHIDISDYSGYSDVLISIDHRTNDSLRVARILEP